MRDSIGGGGDRGTGCGDCCDKVAVVVGGSDDGVDGGGGDNGGVGGVTIAVDGSDNVLSCGDGVSCSDGGGGGGEEGDDGGSGGRQFLQTFYAVSSRFAIEKRF